MMKQVLEVLENNAKATPEQISVITGIEVSEVQRLIKEAENKRIILKYKAVVDWDKLEESQVLALIEVKISPQPDAGYNAIAERIYRFPQVRSAYLASGSSDLNVIVTGKTMREVADFVAQKIAPVEGVHETITHFMLEKYKEDGEVLKAPNEIKRQPLVL